MFRMLCEQYQADQEQRRAIRAERWEQEKRWREEDRAAFRRAREENAVDMDAHNETMKAAAGVSYLTLVCHEDTWTFAATQAFGVWKPGWLSSSYHPYGGLGPSGAPDEQFTVHPNLPAGRIRKEVDGMLAVTLSGHNLVRILDTLHSGTRAEDLAHTARCRTLYGKLAEFVALIDPDAPAGRTTGIEFRIDNSVQADVVQH